MMGRNSKVISPFLRYREKHFSYTTKNNDAKKIFMLLQEFNICSCTRKVEKSSYEARTDWAIMNRKENVRKRLTE